MRLDRVNIFKTLNMIILVAGIAGGAFYSLEAKKYMDKSIFVISPIIHDNRYYFDRNDLEKIPDSGFQGLVSYESIGDMLVCFDEIKAYSQAFYTNRDYFSINQLSFVHGGPWIPEKENERVIVLSESLSWVLFGNTNVVGETVLISDEKYRVVGVVNQGKLARDNCFVWLPLQVAGPIENVAWEEISFSRIFLKASRYNPLDSYKSVVDLLASMNKSERNYHITDMNRYVESIDLRYRLLTFFTGIYTIVMLLLYSIQVGKRWLTVKNKRIPLLILILFDIFMIVSITSNIGIDIWVPAFSGDRALQIFQAVTNIGLLPPPPYLSYSLSELNRLNTNANYCFALGMLGLCQFAFLHKVGTRTIQVTNG